MIGCCGANQTDFCGIVMTSPQPKLKQSSLKERAKQLELELERKEEERRQYLEQTTLERSNSPTSLTAWRSERHLRAFNWFTIKRGKDIEPIEYTSPDGLFKITASPNVKYGLPTVWDADIFDFAITKARELVSSEEDFPGKIRFSITECLEELRKNPASGKNREWVKQAIRRLAFTAYTCTGWYEDGIREKGETLISYEFVPSKSRGELIEITFHPWFVESIRKRNILATDKLITQMLLLENKSGLRKQLIRIVHVRLGNKEYQEFWQDTLMSLCNYRRSGKYFRREIKTFELPWKLRIVKDRGGWKIFFYRQP